MKLSPNAMSAVITAALICFIVLFMVLASFYPLSVTLILSASGLVVLVYVIWSRVKYDIKSIRRDSFIGRYLKDE